VNEHESHERGRAFRFSLIIPVYREFDLIEQCLSHVESLERTNEVEVIVVDGDGGTTLRALGKTLYSFTLKSIVTEKGRGLQFNRGAEESSGSILVFLHVDTTLPMNALSLIETALESCEAGSFRLGIDSKRLFLRLGNILANVRSGLTRIPYGDQVFFIKRELFIKIGGFQNIPIMEDVAFMLALKKLGIKITILHEKVCTSARRWDKEGMLKGTFRNWALYTAYRLGVSPERLHRYYRPHSG
jgi:rSAM/selenodomain-associated transferase 2